MSTPRTRRQLREALEFEKTMLGLAEKQIDTLRTLLDDLGPKLEADGWTPTYSKGIIVAGAPLLADEWTAPNRAAAEERVVAQAVKDARRETLAAVIEALEIRGYDAGLTGTLGGSKPLKRHHNTERFWADLQTALDVREEKRVADERTAAETKVAGLARGENPFLVTGSLVDTQAIRDVLNRRGQVVVTEPYPDFAFGSSYGTAPRVSEEREKTAATAKKKPAKKKSEDKK